MQSSVGRCEAAGCDVAVLLLTGQVCTKTTGFLFVFLRRESKTRYEDFCEDELERYVADRGRAIQKRLGGAQRSTPVCARSARRVVVPLVGVSFRAGSALFAPVLFRWPTPRSVPARYSLIWAACSRCASHSSGC